MCDSEVISRLYASVLHENIQNNRISGADIRTGIQNMKEVYKPNPASLSSSIVDVANYNDVAHRAAYLHKYAPFHTALVADMLHRAILENPKLFKDLIFKSGCVNICSLGGGPGSDIIGVLAVLNETFGFFQVSATIIDCMLNWQVTFNSLIQELRYGNYGYLGECVSEQYFDWSYIGHNLLGKMSDQVNRAISTANLVTMIKFVSASACKDTPAMIKKIFRTLKPGSLVLYIDNAGGGFHQLIRKEAQNCNLITVFGPLKHELYSNQAFNVKRFGYTPCLETKVSVHIWRKPSQSASSNLNATELPAFQERSNYIPPVHNLNQLRVTPARNPSNQAFHNTSNAPWQPAFDYQPTAVHSQSTYSYTPGYLPSVGNNYVVDSRRNQPKPSAPKRQAPKAPSVQTQPRRNTPARPQQQQSEPEYRFGGNEREKEDCCGCCVIS